MNYVLPLILISISAIATAKASDASGTSGGAICADCQPRVVGLAPVCDKAALQSNFDRELARIMQLIYPAPMPMRDFLDQHSGKLKAIEPEMPSLLSARVLLDSCKVALNEKSDNLCRSLNLVFKTAEGITLEITGATDQARLAPYTCSFVRGRWGYPTVFRTTDHQPIAYLTTYKIWMLQEAKPSCRNSGSVRAFQIVEEPRPGIDIIDTTPGELATGEVMKVLNFKIPQKRLNFRADTSRDGKKYLRFYFVPEGATDEMDATAIDLDLATGSILSTTFLKPESYLEGMCTTEFTPVPKKPDVRISVPHLVFREGKDELFETRLLFSTRTGAPPWWAPAQFQPKPTTKPKHK